MKHLGLILLLPFLSLAQPKSALPAKAPASFAQILTKILTDCPNDFENITEAIKDDFEDKELRDYYTNTSLPLADSCYIYETQDENRGVISIFCAHFGTFDKKQDAIKAFNSLVGYLDVDKKSLADFKKIELEKGEDEMYQTFRKSSSMLTDILLEVSMEIDTIQNEDSKKTMDIWQVKLRVLEDQKIEK